MCDKCRSPLYGAIVDWQCSSVNANYLDATCLCLKISIVWFCLRIYNIWIGYLLDHLYI